MSQSNIGVLLVDDELDICEMSKAFLESSKDIQVEAVTSVGEAQVALQRGRFDIIVCDYQMPIANGIELLKSLRAKDDRTPFILFTGKGREDVVIEALNHGADSYLQKGGSPGPLYAELSHRIRAAVRSHRAEQYLRQKEERHRIILDTSISGFWLADLQGHLLEVNQTYARMSGYSIPELLIMSAADLDSNESSADVAAHIQDVLRMGEDRFRSQHRRKDGTVFDVDVGVQFRDFDGGSIVVFIQDITERIRAEEALRLHQKKLGLITDNMLDMVWLLDMQMRPVWMSPSVFQASGYTLEEIALLPMERQLAPSSFNQALQAVGALFTKENLEDPTKEVTFAAELEFINKDGSTQWNDMVYRLVRDEQGRPTSILAVGRDISARISAEKELQDSELRRRALFEGMADPIFIIDQRSGDILEANPAACRMYGYTRDEFVRMKATAVSAEPEETNQAVLNPQAHIPLRYHLRKDGTRFPVEITASTFELQGNPIIIAAARDISERRRAEQEISIREEKYRRLFEMESDALFLVDKRDGQLLEANPAAEKMYGYTREELLCMKGPELSAQIEDTKRSMQSDTTIPLRFHKRKDGSVFPLEITATHFEWNGIPVFICAMRDITERRRSEEALREASRKLNLLSSITRHDITNQLLILQGQLLLMKGMAGSPASSEAHRLKAEAAAQRISGMIHFTKEYEEIGVRAPLWQDCRNLIDKVAREVPLGPVALLNQVPVGTEVYADPLIAKVFYNLVDNAVRHGRGLTTIHFRAELRDGLQSIICEDDGEGISAEAREHLFERGIGKQHGMGLFLSREILAITSIEIVEKGVPGSGARFILTIPLGAYRVRKNAVELPRD